MKVTDEPDSTACLGDIVKSVPRDVSKLTVTEPHHPLGGFFGSRFFFWPEVLRDQSKSILNKNKAW